MSRLSDLLAQVQRLDAQLAKDLSSEVKALSERRQFGLNFERHQPEAVELPGRPVRRGDKVHVLGPREGKRPTDNRIWYVEAMTSDASARVVHPHPTDPETRTVTLQDLVVVAEFRDPIFPGLTSLERIERGGDKPFHAVVDAENFHALEALTYTHEGAVDAIYIDPPYNTGNQGWIYNDSYVAADDVYKHSKWLAFMERRLLLARRLLKPTGVIIVAIGDDEHHRLRMLMDQVFGAENFISDVVWQGVRKNDSRYVSASADYMLIFARDESCLAAGNVRWREGKAGIDEVRAAGREAWTASGGDAALATSALKAWFKKERGRFSANLTNYQKIDEQGRIYYGDNLASPNPRPNLQYDLMHPRTGRPTRRHPNGWRYSRETMDRLLLEGRILFGRDHTTLASYKRFLEEQDAEVPMSVFEQPRRSASQRLESLLGGKRFPNPKDHEVLMRWLRLVAPKDAVILDFFGGSGSTTEAVMRLNEEDDGTRQSILVTNNEVSADDAKKLRKGGHRRGDPEWEARGVFEYVARPRISTVATGVRPDGSTYSEGLAQNVEFFRLTYEQPRVVGHGKGFTAIAPLLWLCAGARGRRIDLATDTFDVAQAYGVLFNLDATGDFLEALAKEPAARTAFIVSDDERAFQMVCDDLPQGVEPVRLYESYLANFAIGGGS